ncbi:MAG: hypothetical protein JWL77_5740 [Chthonomonadaceae bacterium]|jgi:response regulator of citrate/malate metabolism|nr:hypothetical protein [Chthonomonadaceae bacterium]
MAFAIPFMKFCLPVCALLYTKSPDSTKTSADQNVVAALATLRRLLGSERLEALLAAFRQREQLPTRAIAELLKVSSLSARRYLTILGEASLIDEVTQSKYDPRGYWTRTDHSFWLPDTRL